MTELYDGLIVVFWIGDPNDLHFSFVGCESKMYLFVSWIVGDFNSSNADELLKSDHFVVVGIKEVENWLGMFLLYLVLWLYEGEVVDKILKGG
jgi:hypothetical protein